MKMSENVARLVTELEPFIGCNCFSKGSYNVRTKRRGLHYRYPIRYVSKEGYVLRSKGALCGIDLDQIESMHYLTGTNEIYVGRGIISILEELETRFGIDFNKLIEEEISK